jgi:D-psicose/D-tagatose/L-ribulose 3-epimerase
MNSPTSLTPRPVLLHLNFSENDRSTPGERGAGWEETRAGLRKISYGGMPVVEAFGQGLPRLAAATKIRRRMFEGEEKLAAQSPDFMKRSWDRSQEDSDGSRVIPAPFRLL